MSEQVHTLPQASALLGVSVKTLRKRVKVEADTAQAEGRPPQAYLQDHKGGQRWVITQTLLETMQTHVGSPMGSPQGSPMGSPQLVADLQAQLQATQQALDIANLRADHHEQLANERAGRIYDLQQSLVALTSTVKAITEGNTGKRRWWQRKPPNEITPST
jgi:hypothetical protein